jgi:hypothetical protein
MSSEGDELARVTEDAAEFVDKARLRSLFEARDEAAEAIREATLHEIELEERGHDEATQVVDEHVRTNVMAYVLECEPLLRNTDAGTEYWAGYSLGPVPLPSRPEAGVAWDMQPSRTVHVDDKWLTKSRDCIQIPGIGAFVALPSPIRIDWSGPVRKHGTNTQSETVSQKYPVPKEISEDVFRAINRLLADLGIGLDAEAIEDGEASYDYADLI